MCLNNVQVLLRDFGNNFLCLYQEKFPVRTRLFLQTDGRKYTINIKVFFAVYLLTRRFWTNSSYFMPFIFLWWRKALFSFDDTCCCCLLSKSRCVCPTQSQCHCICKLLWINKVLLQNTKIPATELFLAATLSLHDYCASILEILLYNWVAHTNVKK